LRDLSSALSRATSRAPFKDFTRVIPNSTKAQASGGLGISIPEKAPDAARSATKTKPLAAMPGIHAAIAKAYENPGIRSGDRTKGSTRPVSASGTISCHFSQTYVSKTSNILARIRRARNGSKHVGPSALKHQRYIERVGAPEKIVKPRPEEGYERELELEAILELELQIVGRPAGDHELFLGLSEATETTVHTCLSDRELDRLKDASFGTIGNTIAERNEFWRKVNEAEMQPKGDRLIIRCTQEPDWWARALEAVASAPTEVQKALQLQAITGEPNDISVKVSEDTAFAIHEWAMGVGEVAPIEISRGRGGRIQTRIIAELPWELTGRERVEVVRDFTAKLAEKKFPYWAVVHAPGAKNDDRNFHVHIDYYDRPCDRMTDPRTGKEVWDFEILEEKRYSNRTKYTYRPFQQAKAREANGRKWLRTLRGHWEKVTNKGLQKAGIGKRYHLTSNASVGIERDPTSHIHFKTYNKERKGELTADGAALARQQWQAKQDQLVAAHEQRARYRERKLKEETDKARQVIGSRSPYKDVALKEVDRLTKHIAHAGSQISANELFHALGRVVIDRVASRPKLVAHAGKENDNSLGRIKTKNSREYDQSMTFLLEVYGRGEQIVRRNQAELAASRRWLNALLKRLDNMMANPKCHPHDRRAPGFIDLDYAELSPEIRAARAKAAMDRVMNRVKEYYAKAAMPKVVVAAASAPSKPEPVLGKERTLQAPATPQRPISQDTPVKRKPTPVSCTAPRDPIPRLTTDRVSPPRSSELKPISKTAEVEPVQKPAAPTLQELRALPRKTQFRPEPFYKPKDKVVAPVAAPQPKDPTAPSVKSPAPASINSAAKAPAPNNPKVEAAAKPIASANSQPPSKPTVNNVPKPENTVPGTKPARDTAGSAALEPATAAPAPSAPPQAQGPAAAPTDTKPAQTPAPSRPVQAPAAPVVGPTAPQSGSTKESATAKVTLAPVAAPEKTPAPAPVQAPAPRPEPARPVPRAEPSAAKPDATTAAPKARAPAQPDRTSVAPKPSTSESGSARTPGERSGENLDAKPAKAEIRVGNPLSPITPKLMEPIRVEGTKPPKKSKRHDNGRDEGPSM
jgi:hypothetical protein